MKVLGFDTYIESFTDGLQVLRYNKTTAYIVSSKYAPTTRSVWIEKTNYSSFPRFLCLC
jgi:hypothetical protein